MSAALGGLLVWQAIGFYWILYPKRETLSVTSVKEKKKMPRKKALLLLMRFPLASLQISAVWMIQPTAKCMTEAVLDY